MPNLHVKIGIPDKTITRTYSFDPSLSILKICEIIREKESFNSSDHKLNEWGLFLADDDPKKGIWLEYNRTLEYYLIKEGDYLEYRIKIRPLRIKMMDDSIKTILVDDSQLVSQLMMAICSKIGIANSDEYSLVREYLIDPNYQTFATLSRSNKGNTTYNKNAMNENLYANSSPNYATLPHKSVGFDTLTKNEKKMEQMKRKLHTDDEINWVDQSKTLREQGIEEHEILLLRRKFFYSDQNIDSHDPVQLNLLYVQCHDAIINGTHPVTLDETCKFAGIQCQIQYGDHNPLRHKPNFLDLEEFVVKDFRKLKGLEKRIFIEHSNNRGINEIESKANYVKLARELKTYGVAFFLVKEKVKGKNKLRPRLLGVTKESVLKLDENTKEILKNWPLTRVKRWGATPHSFTLDFGDYQDSYYSVQTVEGEKISGLISGYIDIILKNRKQKRKIMENGSGIDGIHHIDDNYPHRLDYGYEEGLIHDEESTLVEEIVSPHRATYVRFLGGAGSQANGPPGASLHSNEIESMPLPETGTRSGKVYLKGPAHPAHRTILLLNDPRNKDCLAGGILRIGSAIQNIEKLAPGTADYEQESLLKNSNLRKFQEGRHGGEAKKRKVRFVEDKIANITANSAKIVAILSTTVNGEEGKMISINSDESQISSNIEESDNNKSSNKVDDIFRYFKEDALRDAINEVAVNLEELLREFEDEESCRSMNNDALLNAARDLAEATCGLLDCLKCDENEIDKDECGEEPSENLDKLHLANKQRLAVLAAQFTKVGECGAKLLNLFSSSTELPLYSNQSKVIEYNTNNLMNLAKNVANSAAQLVLKAKQTANEMTNSTTNYEEGKFYTDECNTQICIEEMNLCDEVNNSLKIYKEDNLKGAVNEVLINLEKLLRKMPIPTLEDDINNNACSISLGGVEDLLNEHKHALLDATRNLAAATCGLLDYLKCDENEIDKKLNDNINVEKDESNEKLDKLHLANKQRVAGLASQLTKVGECGARLLNLISTSESSIPSSYPAASNIKNSNNLMNLARNVANSAAHLVLRAKQISNEIPINSTHDNADLEKFPKDPHLKMETEFQEETKPINPNIEIKQLSCNNSPQSDMKFYCSETDTITKSPQQTSKSSLIAIINKKQLFKEYRHEIINHARKLVEDSKMLITGCTKPISYHDNEFPNNANLENHIAAAGSSAVRTLAQLGQKVKMFAHELYGNATFDEDEDINPQIAKDNLTIQTMLLDAIKDLATALGDLIQAAKQATNKNQKDPQMSYLKESAKVMVNNVTVLLKTLKQLEESSTSKDFLEIFNLQNTIDSLYQDLRIYECYENNIETVSSEFMIESCRKILIDLNGIFRDLQNGTLPDNIIFVICQLARHHTADILRACKGIEQKNDEKLKLLEFGKEISLNYISFLEIILKNVEIGNRILELNPELQNVYNNLIDLINRCENMVVFYAKPENSFPPISNSNFRDDILENMPTPTNDEELERYSPNTTERELLLAANVIEKVANGLNFFKSRIDKVETDQTAGNNSLAIELMPNFKMTEMYESSFDGRIICSTQAIANASASLIRAACAAQRELLRLGVQTRDAKQKSSHYYEDGQWSLGLISAARLVVEATKDMCESAHNFLQNFQVGSTCDNNNVCNDRNNQDERQAGMERLIISAKQVASGTAHLTLACKVKAGQHNPVTSSLEKAGNDIKKATEGLILIARQSCGLNLPFPYHDENSGAEITSETYNEEDNMGDYIQGTGLKRVGTLAKEIEAQQEILRKERELEEARIKLGVIRKAKYYTAALVRTPPFSQTPTYPYSSGQSSSSLLRYPLVSEIQRFYYDVGSNYCYQNQLENDRVSVNDFPQPPTTNID